MSDDRENFPPANSMSEIRERNRAIGHHWFDADSMRFFKTRIVSGSLVVGNKASYFITRETNPTGQNAFSIRVAKPTGQVGTIGKFHHFASSRKAKKALRDYITRGESVEPNPKRSRKGKRRAMAKRNPIRKGRKIKGYRQPSFVFITLHDGYVSYRTDKNDTGSYPVTDRNTVKQIVNHIRDYWQLKENEMEIRDDRTQKNPRRGARKNPKKDYGSVQFTSRGKVARSKWASRRVTPAVMSPARRSKGKTAWRKAQARISHEKFRDLNLKQLRRAKSPVRAEILRYRVKTRANPRRKPVRGLTRVRNVDSTMRKSVALIHLQKKVGASWVTIQKYPGRREAVRDIRRVHRAFPERTYRLATGV